MIYKAIIEDLCQNLVYEDLWEEATIISMGRIAINDKPYLTHYVFVLWLTAHWWLDEVCIREAFNFWEAYLFISRTSKDLDAS